MDNTKSTPMEIQQMFLDYVKKGEKLNVIKMLREKNEALLCVIGEAAALALNNGYIEIVDMLLNQGDSRNSFDIILEHHNNIKPSKIAMAYQL
jgi:hypothetical protein